ncbi:Protein CBG18528 [Caenorhabditis briggsae]|uniref:Protein CBG18528 n=1 Tax=Caenorhabditis briggsae TaxID=6238 RepID=A8XTI1_CAEBR|nr:Protein CBG18528 [Caenorhabditis briggsae]CAP35958.2 Protein CBG18528 [Caenorhabditis briggsae]
MLTSDAPQVMLYVLLRLFQIFVKVIGDNNNGNTDLACSILRDFADNWPEFYETLVRYFELYSDEISKTEDFKLSQEYIDKEKKYVIRIEYFYPDDGKKTASVEEKRPQELTEKFGQLKLSQKNKTVMETLRLMATESIPNPIKNFCTLQNAFTIFFRTFSGHRFLPQQNKFRSIEQAPEVPKIEKAALVTDAKTESHSKSDEEETFENHREVPKLEKMRPDTDPKTVSGREDLNTDGKEAFQNYYETCEPTKPGSLFEQFEKDMELSNSSQPEPSSDDSKYEIVNFMEEEILQMADQISVHSLEQTRKTVTGLQTDRNELEERSSTLCTPLEEDVDTENEGFIEKLEEQKKRHEEELERRRQERTEKQEKLNEELREIRRLQKQKFAMLLQCIQWRYRFQEKEGEWSDWIEHCYRRLIVMVITQFAVFQEELGVSEKAFRKTLAVSPETVQSEVTNLWGKIETTIHKLSIIFENLAKIYENFEDALFIRILQRSSCDISTKLISVLNCLDAIEYSTEWYQELISKFDHIETSDVPGVTELKRLRKEDNIDGLGNMEFPKWEPRSHVNIEELSSDEEENVMEDKPKNSNDSSNEVPESAEGIPMEFVKTGKGMAHPEDSKTASNSDRTETKDSQQIGQVVCSVPTSVGLDEVEQFSKFKVEFSIKKVFFPACDKATKVEIEEFSEDEEDIVKDKLKGFHKQITSKKTAPIAEIEELLSDEDEAAVEEKSEQDKFQEVNPLKCSCECKKRAVDLEDPSIPNNRTGKCSDEEDIKILMGEILVRVSSSMDDNFENQAKSSTRTTPRKELKMDEMVCEETPDYADKKKCLMLLYDHLLRQPLTWNRIHPMKITHSARVNNNYPPQLVRVWNEIVKKEKKFLDLQQIIELEKSKIFKLKFD